MKFSGFKVPKHRKFGYIPRHYDPKQEELDKRLNRYKADISDKEMLKERISHGFKQSYTGDADYRKALVRKSNRRLVLIILTLFLIGFVLLSSDKILNIIQRIEG